MRPAWIAIFVFLTLGLWGLASSLEAAPVVLVEQGQARCVIYYDAGAPKSVQDAAILIQSVVRKSTGVTLPIQTTPASPMLALGANEAAGKAGIDPQTLPEAGYLIVAKGADVFLAGRDTPDGAERWEGMGLANTAMAASTFCEKVLGARWLFPGELGEDIPRAQRIVVGEMDLREVPSVRHRMLMTFGAFDMRADVDEWKIRNKTSPRRGVMTITWGHSFDDFPKRYGRGLEQLMQEHPEFMALGKDGERTKLPSPRGYPQWKYCLSNPELIKAFSEGVNDVFDRNPGLSSTSISPSDGHNWCECSECLKDTLKIPPQWQKLGLAEPQYTPSVLKFYNAVARLVAEKHPDRVLGALVYQSYLVPPEPPIALEKNLLLGVAMNSGYGFKFYRPERLEAFRKVYSEWGKVAPRLGYTSYSTWMRNWFGFPMPCGREMMKLEFGVLREHPPEVLHYSGYDAMGYGAATNYVAAKMMWDATADPDVLFREFLERAYGSAAATILEQMDQMVQERLKRFIEATPKTDHEVDYATVKSVFAPIFPQIEEMYFQAVAAKKTDVQQQRLEMLGDNLILAHFNMRNAGLDTLGEKSRFYKTPEQFEAFMASRAGSIGMIDVKAWLKTYGHSYQNMPILTAGWRPK